MTKPVTLLVATALAGAVCLSGFASASLADDRGARQGQQMRDGGIMNIVCSSMGAQRLETRLNGLPDHVKLTTGQLALFDTFKTAALTAQTGFADNCVAPSGPGGDLLQRLKSRQTNLTAYVAAIDSVMPSLEAFYTSLTDAQKNDLRPGHTHRFGNNWRRHGPQHGRDGAEARGWRG